MRSPFYVTTPIYYINDVPHLGTAYTTIAADVLARYARLRGADTRFLTGTDEHGIKVQRVAEQRGLAPQAYADDVSAMFRSAWPRLSVAPDDFIRTSEERHKKGVQALWSKIADHGDLYLSHYEGLYCVGCEAYFTEKDLKQPGNLCPIHGTPAESVKEESYFFRLSKYGERLLAFYERNPSFVQPSTRMNEVKAFVAQGLQDLSVSRTTFQWGIPVPGDPRHVMYVWFDALSNYLTAVSEPPELRRFWPASVHLVGKDILRFHAIFWPAFLMAAGYPDEALPRQVYAHGFLTYGGQKMSKSLRNTVSPAALAEAISPTIGSDAVRYCLMRAISFGQDGDFSIDDVLARYGSELGNALGNLLNRVQPFAKAVPAKGATTALEEELRAAHEAGAKAAAEAFDAYHPTRALEAIWTILAAANAYVDKAAPWAAKKQGDEGRLGTIVATLVEELEAISVLVAPVMPNVADAMRDQLGVPRLAPVVGHDVWPFATRPRAEGQPLPGGAPIFPRFEKEKEAEIRATFAAPAEAPAAPAEAKSAPEKPADKHVAPAEAKPAVTYDDFAKIDLRVGVVLSAERVKKKDKLLDLRVDLGEPEPRRIVAGIALSYAPEAVVGRRVVVLANLAPRDFGKGLVSQGMLLAADDGDGLKLAAVDGAPPVGSSVR